MSFNLVQRPLQKLVENYNDSEGFAKIGAQTRKIYREGLSLSKRIMKVAVPQLIQAIYPENLKLFFASVLITSSVNDILQSMLSFKWRIHLPFYKGVLDQKIAIDGFSPLFSNSSNLSGVFKSVLIAAAFFSWTGTTFLGNRLIIGRRQQYPLPESIG